MWIAYTHHSAWLVVRSIEALTTGFIRSSTITACSLLRRSVEVWISDGLQRSYVHLSWQRSVHEVCKWEDSDFLFLYVCKTIITPKPFVNLRGGKFTWHGGPFDAHCTLSLHLQISWEVWSRNQVFSAHVPCVDCSDREESTQFPSRVCWRLLVLVSNSFVMNAVISSCEGALHIPHTWFTCHSALSLQDSLSLLPHSQDSDSPAESSWTEGSWAEGSWS